MNKELQIALATSLILGVQGIHPPRALRYKEPDPPREKNKHDLARLRKAKLKRDRREARRQADRERSLNHET